MKRLLLASVIVLILFTGVIAADSKSVNQFEGSVVWDGENKVNKILIVDNKTGDWKLHILNISTGAVSVISYSVDKKEYKHSSSRIDYKE